VVQVKRCKQRASGDDCRDEEGGKIRKREKELTTGKKGGSASESRAKFGSNSNNGGGNQEEAAGTTRRKQFWKGKNTILISRSSRVFRSRIKRLVPRDRKKKKMHRSS